MRWLFVRDDWRNPEEIPTTCQRFALDAVG
jgi:hypothetical protein